MKWLLAPVRRVAFQVYIDVLESVNLLMSSNGAVLRNDVTGKVIMKTILSGELRIHRVFVLTVEDDPTGMCGVSTPI